MRQATLSQILENKKELLDGDLFVQLTIHDIPASLLRDFMLKVVWPTYPGGVSPAIKDLMLKAVEEKQKETMRDSS